MLDISPEPECTSGQPGTPFSLVQVSLTKQEYIDPKWQVNHYRDLWERARDRERELTAAIALMKKEHKAKVEQLKVSESLANHWEGLVRFIQNPDVSMDSDVPFTSSGCALPAVAGRRCGRAPGLQPF
ncbi:hypothetical protein J7438_01510 [Thalassotalea sp. G20_0]|uniref:hypothetical protein n=1 Tax=Thalassotalea sp. G20_0 TaxID=2821093 RepID=UPI001ADB6056|nr:hypothetical protein [Thalassotalea sp. G20_0]MBO9492770.1 hypothetical protein [Thalassotalea sp. G20_0]